MRRFFLVWLVFAVAVVSAPAAWAWRGGGAIYHGPRGGTAVVGPRGGAAVRGPQGNVAVRGPTVNVYGGIYHPYAAGVATGLVVGTVAGAAVASTYYPPPYYYPPCGPPYTPYCP